MYFWHIQKVREELATGKIAEHNVFKYFIAHVFLYSAAMIPFYDTNEVDIIIGMVHVPIIIGGLMYVYRCNGSHTGKDFFTRLFAISWVISIRFIAVVALLTLFGGFFEDVSGTSSSAESTFGTLLVVCALSLVFYWRVGVHMRRTNELIAEQATTTHPDSNTSRAAQS